MMAKFIRIRNNLINLDKVVTIAQELNEIWVYYDDGNPTVIEYDTEREAQLVFEDIPHLIDNSVIPDWVRESNDGATCKPEYFNMDYSYDELPF